MQNSKRFQTKNVARKNAASVFKQNHCSEQKVCDKKSSGWCIHQKLGKMLIANPFFLSTTFFSRISLDNLNIRVRRTRTRKSDYCNMSLLFGCDCTTGYFFCLPIYDLSAKSLISALQVLFIKYAQPLEIITDAHATFCSVAMNNPWP